MYDGICISCKNKHSNIRCGYKSKSNTLLCGYHKRGTTKLYIDLLSYNLTSDNLKQLYILKKKIYGKRIYSLLTKNNDHTFLDKKYSTYLITGDSSWQDIPKKYRIYLNKNELWDIRFLVNYFATQLNCSNSSMPSPQLPKNPFTRKIYSYKNLLKFKNKLDTLHDIVIPIQLKIFLQSKITEFIINESPSYKLTEYFKTQLRYKILNEKDSQDNYIGKWIDKNVNMSTFENLYHEWNNIPPYIASIGNIMIPNPEKDFFNEILNTCENE